ncbi:LysR family transcriptional regulator [Photobacterium leiognathi]|uniref:LysR family transcriptional regulator n=1 Tax=Photobacterium leiognathi TaxID=553611 RepID=UPI001EDEE530|nr:LysR family transcriptional regulator [Photobacterium leiognathi]MCG3883280.1 LysR family transcriptional regulator [Photobacterium leiognathi]
MDTRFLETLITVVEQGSIAAAAREQLLTPAAVSQRIQSLEREFKCKLFSRAGNTVQPTNSCLMLLPKAKALVKDTRSLIETATDSHLKGTLNVGVNSTSLTAYIPSTLQYLRTAAPDAKFSITPGNSIDLYQQVIDGDIDAAIMMMPFGDIPKSLQYWILREEPLAVICHKSVHGTAKKILSQNPYIRYDPRCWGGKIAESYVQAEAITSEPIFDLDSLEIITQLVADNVGVSVIPYWFALDKFKNDINIITIPHKKYQRRIVAISAYHPQQPHLLNLFIDSLRT